MKQELELEEVDFQRDSEMDEETIAEDQLDEGSPWEIAFERGHDQANEKTMEEDWREDDEW